MGLESPDSRRRLETYALLAEQCSISKSHQNAVGDLLRQSKASDSSLRLLDGVVRDLQAKDSTLRVSATRLVCHAVYENLRMQEIVMQRPQHAGFSVGWVHVFSVPQRYKEQQDTTKRGHQEFLRAIVREQYASVYDPVSRYYAADCRSFLPRWWQFPAPDDKFQDAAEGDTVPDPQDHLVGFFLVPRQTQIPEATDQDLVQALDESDVDHLRRLKELFDAVASSQTVERNALVQTIETHKTELQWLLNALEPEAVVQLIAGGRISSSIAWHQVLTHCCTQLHGAKLREVFGNPVYESLLSIFQRLALSCDPPFAWEPVLMGAVLSQQALPVKLKRHIRRLAQGRYRLKTEDAGQLEQPWRHLLDLTLEAVLPISWSLFLARWRLQAADCERQDTLRRPPVPHSVLSVPDMRKSIVGMDLRSVRDLGQLETQLPLLCRSIASFSGVRMLEPSKPVDEAAEAEEAQSDEDELERAENCGKCHHHEDSKEGALTRRSLEELNALCQKRSQVRLEAKRRALEQIASSKTRYVAGVCAFDCCRCRSHDWCLSTRAAAEKDLAKRELEQRQLEFLDKQSETEKQRAQRRELLHVQQSARHESVLRRKEQYEAGVDAKVREAAAIRVQRREEAQHRQLRRQQQERPTSARRPAPPKSTTAAKAPPRSARSTSANTNAVDPEMRRLRSQTYGDAVCKLFMAETAAKRPNSPSAEPQSSLARQLSTFRMQSFRTAAPQRPSSAKGSEKEHKHKCCDHDDGDSKRSAPVNSKAVVDALAGTACQTLVMSKTAVQVSERISIPSIPVPTHEDPPVPPFIIEAQYNALSDPQKQQFRERFNLKRVSHRVTYTVLKQFTKMVRRDTAWQLFHEVTTRAHGGVPCKKLKHADFVLVAQQLGIAKSPKKLLLIARTLDDQKSGYVEWKQFYTWWSLQYDEHALPVPL